MSCPGFVRRGAVIVALLLAALSGCEGGGNAADITFEIALPPDAERCGQDVVDGIESLRTAPCASVRVFEQTASGLVPVRLYDPDGDHQGTGSLERRVLLNEVRRIAFDARIVDPEQPHTLVFRIYDNDLEPAFGATVESVRFAGQGDRVRVRLYPFREWSCAGRDATANAAARALHEAVRLPSGDVLILGGVRGAGIRAESITNPAELAGAPLERSMLLYLAREHELVVLGGVQLGRVGFAARYDRTDEAGRYVVQVVGGYEMPADAEASPAILFDNAGRFAPYGAPFVSSFRAVSANNLELTIDVTARTVTSAELTLSGAPRGALNVVSETIDVTSTAGPTRAAAVLVGFTRPYVGELDLPVSSTFFFLLEGGGPPPNTPAAMLTNGRLGGSVTALPDRGGFLVWGGSVNDPGALSITEAAGEVVFLDRAPEPVPTGTGIPLPSAFHTATRFPSDDTVLVVGGYEVRSDGFIGTRPLDTPIFALRVTGTGVEGRAVVSCASEICPYTSTALHTATVVPGLGLVVTGGARTENAFDGTRARRFDPIGQVGVVTPDLRYQPFGADLTFPRFGHTATLLEGNRLLVIGGLALDEGTTDQAFDLAAVARPEIIYLDPAPPRLIDGTCMDTDMVPDAGMTEIPDSGPFVRTDAGGQPDAGPLPDGGPVLDAGVPLGDGGTMTAGDGG